MYNNINVDAFAFGMRNEVDIKTIFNLEFTLKNFYIKPA